MVDKEIDLARLQLDNETALTMAQQVNTTSETTLSDHLMSAVRTFSSILPFALCSSVLDRCCLRSALYAIYATSLTCFQCLAFACPPCPNIPCSSLALAGYLACPCLSSHWICSASVAVLLSCPECPCLASFAPASLCS
jgi:hypothetical protein